MIDHLAVRAENPTNRYGGRAGLAVAPADGQLAVRGTPQAVDAYVSTVVRDGLVVRGLALGEAPPTPATRAPGTGVIDRNDDTGTAQEGRSELQVHANPCWTASGPATIVGSSTITDTAERDVTNPVNAFDGCFDPDGRAA